MGDQERAWYEAAMIQQLFAFLFALSPLLDGHGRPIRAPESALRTIANAAAETESPRLFAAWLFVLGAHESGYHTGVTGDGGKSCGAYQTPCAVTPSDGLGQSRLAIKILRQAMAACPEHVLWAYASGRCVYSTTAARYEREVREVLVQ